MDFFNNFENFTQVKLPGISTDHILDKYKFGIGLNSDSNIGEPHIILLLDLNGYSRLTDEFFNKKQQASFDHSHLRLMTSFFGSKISFNKKIFPKGINFSIAVLIKQKMYISTHERNLNLYFNCIKANKDKMIFCSCNTKACGTAGAIAANLALITNKINSGKIATVHLGGEIDYIIKNNITTMVGGVERLNLS